MLTLGRGANKRPNGLPIPRLSLGVLTGDLVVKRDRENANPAILVTMVTVVLPITDQSWSQLQSLLQGDVTSCQDSMKSFWGVVLPLQLVLGFSLQETPIVG